MNLREIVVTYLSSKRFSQNRVSSAKITASQFSFSTYRNLHASSSIFSTSKLLVKLLFYCSLNLLKSFFSYAQRSNERKECSIYLNKRDASPRNLIADVSLRPSAPPKIPVVAPRNGTRLIKVHARVLGAYVPLIKSHRSASWNKILHATFFAAVDAKLFPSFSIEVSPLRERDYEILFTDVRMEWRGREGEDARACSGKILVCPQNFVRDPTSLSSSNVRWDRSAQSRPIYAEGVVPSGGCVATRTTARIVPLLAVRSWRPDWWKRTQELRRTRGRRRLRVSPRSSSVTRRLHPAAPIRVARLPPLRFPFKVSLPSSTPRVTNLRPSTRHLLSPLSLLNPWGCIRALRQHIRHKDCTHGLPNRVVSHVLKLALLGAACPSFTSDIYDAIISRAAEQRFIYHHRILA